MKNLGLGFTLPEKRPTDEYDIPAIIESVQQYAFQRRLRVKDGFRDYDQLRCGRCTRQQFMRGVNVVMPSLRKDELEALADHYTEEGVHVQRPQVIGYKRFVSAVEEVFTVAHLERMPLRVVPRSGATLQNTFRPVTVGVDREEERVQAILLKIALLCKTRGMVFLSCFQDCDRSDSISLVTPRYSGKATPSQFRQHFPLVGDFDDSELRLLAKRYTTPSGDVNYQALDSDITAAAKDVPAPTGDHAPCNRVPQSPMSSVANRRLSADRCRREADLKVTLQSVDIMDKLRAIVSERRLRLGDCFVDFDKLRKGLCTMSQLQTVFTVLGIELEPQDYKNLGEIFRNEEGLFCYREFCTNVCEIQQMNIGSWDMELPPTPRPSTARIEDERPGSRIRYLAPLSDSQQERLAFIEDSIRRRAEVWSLDLKKNFQDFDKVCTGHVTRTQFHRIMNMMQYELTKAHADMLCQAYCDTDNGQEFNYIDFCDSLKLSLDMRVTGKEEAVALPSGRRSKYYDRSGETISPWSPMDATASSFRDSEVTKVGGMSWSRGCSR